MYGALPLLITMEHFIKTEQFEECIKIEKAIKEQEIQLDYKLPRSVNKDAIEGYYEAYKKINLTEKQALNNAIMFSEIIIKDVKRLNTK